MTSSTGTLFDALRARRLSSWKARDDDSRYALLPAPTLLYLGIVFVLPLAVLIADSVVVDHRLSLTNFVAYLSDAHNRKTLWTTLRFALLSSVFCLLLGYPFARLMGSVTGRMQGLLFTSLLLPMSLSLIVRAFGWTILLGRDGPINQALLATGILEHPVRLLFTEFGLVLGTVSIKLPLMILPIYVVLQTIPREIDEVGASLGAGAIYRFVRLDLPLAMPGMLAGFALVFSQAAAAYVLPTLLGGARLQIMSNEIVDSYLILQAGSVGSTISVLLLAIIAVVLIATNAIASRRARP
jgi:putative spermidine/putrescine transport system permease protein